MDATGLALVFALTVALGALMLVVAARMTRGEPVAVRLRTERRTTASPRRAVGSPDRHCG